MLTEVGFGNRIYELRKRIQGLRSEIVSLGNAPQHMPELVEYANLLRANQYYAQSDTKKSELITAYEQYSKAIEQMLTEVFDIQNSLKDLLKEQSKLLESKTKTRTKAKKNRTKR